MEAIMTSVGNKFSFKRFASYLNLYMTANKRKLLLGILQVFIFTFIFMLLLLYSDGIKEYEYNVEYQVHLSYDPFWSSNIPFIPFTLCVFMAFAGSWMFSSMSSKSRRLNTIEIPALQSEKFLAWWCLYLPLAFLLIFAGIWVAEILRVIWVKIFTPYGNQAHILSLDCLLRFISPRDKYTDSMYLEASAVAFCIYSLVVACNALFSLGSIVFHKLNFLKTVISGFVLMALYVLFFLMGSAIFFGSDSMTAAVNGFDDPNLFFYLFGGIVFVVSTFVYILAYCRYREEEIINRW